MGVLKTRNDQFCNHNLVLQSIKVTDSQLGKSEIRLSRESDRINEKSETIFHHYFLRAITQVFSYYNLQRKWLQRAG